MITSIIHRIVTLLGVLLFGAILPASYAAGTQQPSAEIHSEVTDRPATADSTDYTPGRSRLTASLLTCSPGAEVYELFGHEAIRIRGIDEKGLPVDTVWNYGVFDFAAPNFLYRFVKGETDYMVEPCPMDWFMAAYIHRGTGVTEQDLNLSQQETYTLRRLLQINSLPQNRTYRYNYVRDNCATRIVDMIDAAVAPRKVVFPDTIYYPTFRTAMREFHKDYPWYQFGIDLVLGGGLDVPVTTREELFAPLLLEQKAAFARFEDGAPLVSNTHILYPGPLTAVSDQQMMERLATQAPDLPTLRQMGHTLAPTPWILSPMCVAIILMLGSFWIGWWQFRNARIIRWAYALFFTLLGLAGCVVWFLVFCSSHDSTSPNLLSLWLNPIQLAVALFIWWDRTRGIAVAMAAVDVIIMIMLIAAWPLQTQVANPAVFPLWATTLTLSFSLVMVEIINRRKIANATK